MTENKRFTIRYDGYKYFCVYDELNERLVARLDTMSDAKAVLELIEIYNGLR